MLDHHVQVQAFSGPTTDDVPVRDRQSNKFSFSSLVQLASDMTAIRDITSIDLSSMDRLEGEPTCSADRRDHHFNSNFTFPSTI